MFSVACAVCQQVLWCAAFRDSTQCGSELGVLSALNCGFRESLINLQWLGWVTLPVGKSPQTGFFWIQ